MWQQTRASTADLHPYRHANEPREDMGDLTDKPLGCARIGFWASEAAPRALFGAAGSSQGQEGQRWSAEVRRKGGTSGRQEERRD